MNPSVIFYPNEAAFAACRAAASSPPGPGGSVVGAKRSWKTLSSCSLGTGMNYRDLEERMQWPECETCGKQDLLHLSCQKCSSPVCGDCVTGKCGVCDADLQLAFRGCDLCGRVLRRRGTRMCVHCTETWCFGCIDSVGTCGCGGLTEEGFLRPLDEVEAPLPVQGGGPPVPCLSTASSCNLVCVADTACSDRAAAAAAAAAAAGAATLSLAPAAAAAIAAAAAAAAAAPHLMGVRRDGHSCSGAAPAAALAALGGGFAAGSLMRPQLAAVEYGSDDDGPQCSSTGGGCI